MTARVTTLLVGNALVGRLGARARHRSRLAGLCRRSGIVRVYGGGEDVAARSSGGVLDPRAVVAGGLYSARDGGSDDFNVFFAGGVVGLCEGNLVVI